jgi:ABC-type uncharacterized transport system substrate-binding protein
MGVRRRQFLGLVGGAAATWPLTAYAQQSGRVRRIGLLETVPATMNAANLNALRQALRDLGYVEGSEYIFEYRSAEGKGERFPDLAAELVMQKVDVIVTRGTPAVIAAKAATTTIPVVMAAIADPFLVITSLAHPGGNVTGLSAFVADLQAKRVDLLKNIFPDLRRIAALLGRRMGNPTNPPQWKEIEAAANLLGLQSQLLVVRQLADFEVAFDNAAAQHVEAIIVGIDVLTQMNAALIATLALKHRMVSIYASREFVNAGGLISYGVSYPSLYRRSAAYIDKIFKGARPGDLPIEQPTKFELVINLKTAKILGLTIPDKLLFTADEVIE